MFYSIQHKNIDIEAWLLLSFFIYIPLSDLFCELHNEKTLFSIMDERNSVFLIFTIKLFSTALIYLTAQPILNLT